MGRSAVFRYKPKIQVPYDVQGYIYFWSRRYRELSAEERETVRRACRQAGGEHYAALLEFVTTDRGKTAICSKHFLSQETLQRAVNRYYKIIAQDIK